MSNSMPTSPDSRTQRFLENLVKLIPAEIIALYAVLSGFVPEDLVGQLFITVPLFVLTPFYMYFSMKISKISQIVISSVAFAVWLFAIGGPFVYFPWYEAWMGGALLALYTLIPPMAYQKRLPAYEGENQGLYDEKLTATGPRKSWREID